MNKSQRILLNNDNKEDDKYIKVKLEQSVKTLEFLSMSIDTTDIYQNFNSDYGVLVGRVIANNNIGVPNAKISIFIPLTDSDSTDPEIYSIYPYTTPRDTNNEGKRYNLLPRVGKYNNGIVRPPQPFGSLPIKEEIVTNEQFLNVYKKYYKYTATTNDAGDYMIFGVPIGTQTVHLSVDITDIGKYSMSPASMIKSLGYSENLFTNGTTIKPSNNLNDLPHIETQEIGVDIIPFWGDENNFEIGITRQDFKIRSVIRNTFTIFGSVFTDPDGSMWGEGTVSGIKIMELYRASDQAEVTISIARKRSGKVTEKIYYYPAEITDAEIDNPDPNVADPINSMKLLNETEYSIYKRDEKEGSGDFVIIVNCNRDKVITDNFGNERPVPNDYPGGVFTKFRGFVTIEMTPEDKPLEFTGSLGKASQATFQPNSKIIPYRYILKFPQYADRNASFAPKLVIEDDNTKNWRKKHFNFSAGNYYSFARFHGTTYNSTSEKYDSNNTGFFEHESINEPYHKDPFWNVGIIATGPIGNEIINTDYEFPTNSQSLASSNYTDVFGANWLNFSIYLPQLSYLIEEFSKIGNVRTADNFSVQSPNSVSRNHYYNEDNDQDIAAGVTNTKWFARADLHWTDIIEVPVTDIQTFYKISKKGFKSTEVAASVGGSSTFTEENYRNGVNNPHSWIYGACPINGGKLQGNPNASPDPESYFYKGVGKSNCIEYLFKLGLVR